MVKRTYKKHHTDDKYSSVHVKVTLHNITFIVSMFPADITKGSY